MKSSVRAGAREVSRDDLLGDVGGIDGLAATARDPHATPLMLDLDLGQTGLVEERRELADQVLVETAPLLRHERRPLAFRHHLDFPAAMEAASASIASS